MLRGALFKIQDPDARVETATRGQPRANSVVYEFNFTVIIEFEVPVGTELNKIFDHVITIQGC